MPLDESRNQLSSEIELEIASSVDDRVRLRNITKRNIDIAAVRIAMDALPPELQERCFAFLPSTSLCCLAVSCKSLAAAVEAEGRRRLAEGPQLDTRSGDGETALQLLRFREIRSEVQAEAGRCQTFIAKADGMVLACGLLGRLALAGKKSTERAPTQLVY